MLRLRMLKILSKEEHDEHHKQLGKFIKNNHCDMYNYMRDVKGFREQGVLKERSRILKVLNNMKFTVLVRERIIKEIWKQPEIELKKRYDKLGITFHKVKK